MWSAHANSLVSGLDNADRLLDGYPQWKHVLEGLFSLAGRVRNTLVPVEPAEGFVADLKVRLGEAKGKQTALKEDQRKARRMVWQMAGAAGLMLSGLAIVALAVRAIIAILSRRAATTI